MSQIHRVVLCAGVAGTALMAAGCSSSTTGSTAPPASSAAAPASSAPAPAGDSAVPAPPTGSQELSTASNGGVEYARYSISGTSAEQVVSGYTSEAQADGYTVTNNGGSGGGWGGWGGSGAGMEASKSGSYLNVQAGGQSGGTTYFEVCVGADQSAVDNCDQQSRSDHQNQNQNQNQNDSHSGGS